MRRAGFEPGILRGYLANLIECRDTVHCRDLIARHGFGHRLRWFDALQLGVALDLRDQGLGKTIGAADVTLGEVAAKEGLMVLNPKGSHPPNTRNSTPKLPYPSTICHKILAPIRVHPR